MCPFCISSHTKEQRRLQHQEWDPHRFPAMEPTMIAGGCRLEVRTTPTETMKVHAMPLCTTGRDGVIGTHEHGNVVKQVADVEQLPYAHGNAARHGRPGCGGEWAPTTTSPTPVCQLLSSANTETIPQRTQAAATVRKHCAGAACEGKNG